MSANLGPPPINALPIGLLDLFGIKSGGKYPQHFVEALAPTFELQQWYLEAQVDTYTFSLQNLFAASASANLIAITATTPALPIVGGQLVVPNNELWIVLPGTRILAGFSANAGQSIDVDLLHRVNATDQFVWWPTRFRGFNTSDAAIIRNGIAVLDQTVFVPPGAQINGYHYGVLVPAGDVDIGGTLRLMRLVI